MKLLLGECLKTSTNEKSTLVQVMAWYLMAPSHYLSQCWPRSILLYGVIRPQWVNSQTAAKVRYGWVITSHRKLWDIITYPCLVHLISYVSKICTIIAIHSMWPATVTIMHKVHVNLQRAASLFHAFIPNFSYSLFHCNFNNQEYYHHKLPYKHWQCMCNFLNMHWQC